MLAAGEVWGLAWAHNPSMVGSIPAPAIIFLLQNPLYGSGYQFWSGIGSDVFLATGIAAAARHLNCDKRGCWRLGHRHPDHGRPTCRRHYHHDLKPKEPTQ